MWTRTLPSATTNSQSSTAPRSMIVVARLERHLLEEARHRDQRVAGNVAEQRDALEHGDALDRHERVGRVHITSGVMRAHHAGSKPVNGVGDIATS